MLQNLKQNTKINLFIFNINKKQQHIVAEKQKKKYKMCVCELNCVGVVF